MTSRHVVLGMVVAAWLAAAACAGESPVARRITVPGEGVLRVTRAELDSWGLSAGGLHVYTDDRGLSFRRVADGVEFYSAPFASLYARERAFLVSNRPLAAKGTSREDGAPGAARSFRGWLFPGRHHGSPRTVASYVEVCHVEEDQFYMSGLAGAAPDEEHWFYSTYLMPGRTLQLTADLDGPLAPGMARMVVALRGATDAPGTGPDHNVAVTLNGVKLGEMVWGGLVRKETSFDLPAGLAVVGPNTVELAGQSVPGVTLDTVMVDWVDIRYPRGLVARADRLNFDLETSARQRISVDGFTGPDVAGFDVTDPYCPRPLALRLMRSGAAWCAEWTAPFAGKRRYALAGPGGRLPSSSNRPADPWTCRRGVAYDYLVVTHEDYRAPAASLAALHQAKGLKAQVFPAEQVYDAFGCGQPLPDAVRALAGFAPPKYLCLVGDATGDPRGLMGPVGCGVIPSYFSQGPYFEVPSDHLFGCVDGADLYPEVAVGRLPARSEAQAQAMVDKAASRLAHGSDGEADVRAALIVGDNSMDIFEQGANELAGLFSWGSVEKVMFSGYPNAAAIRAAIIAGWGRSPRYFAYYGHAAGNFLGKGGVLRDADVPSLAAEPLPAGIILGCLAGFFNYPNGAECLAERMLREPGRGTCCLVAPAGMTAPEGQLVLGREIAKAIADGRAQSLGEALMLAKRRLPPAHVDVMTSFNLLGDPALK